MSLTRRTVLAAAGVAIARGQRNRDELQVTGRSGLRIEQHGDSQRPAIAVFLPSLAAPVAVIAALFAMTLKLLLTKNLTSYCPAVVGTTR